MTRHTDIPFNPMAGWLRVHLLSQPPANFLEY